MRPSFYQKKLNYNTLVKKVYILYSFILLTVFNANAGDVSISGTAPEYSDIEISFYALDDYISEKEILLASVQPDSVGQFSVKFKINETQEIYTYLGVFKAFITVEPGKQYNILLPPRIDKTLAEEVSSFFEPEEISIGVKSNDTTSLNYLIHTFSHYYESFINESFSWLYISADRGVVDSVIRAIDSIVPFVGNDYFNMYKQYKFALLRHFAFERDKNYVTRKYLLNNPILYNNRAYFDFFEQVWKDYLTISSFDSEKLYNAIVYGKSPSMVYSIFDKNLALRNDTLKELLLLYGIHEAFAKPDDFPPQTLNQTLDSIIIQSKVQKHTSIAQNIKDKYDLIRSGDMLPDAQLMNINGEKISLVPNEEKYIYLNFCRSENFACQKDYRLLKSIKEEFSENLEIITISFDKDFATYSDYVKGNSQYDWTFLYAKSRKEIEKIFNVKAMPSYYLIDSQGKIIMLPAPSPHENFSIYFTQIINWRRRVLELENNKSGNYFQTPGDY